MWMTSWRPMAVLTLVALGLPASAAVLSFSGALDDAGNPALVASDLGAAQFGDALATANNVALHGFSLATGGQTRIRSTGFATGGIDPYVTLFAGSDRASATVVASNYDNALQVGGDFDLDALLAPGDYTLAIGVFLNMSLAENLGGGVLADGFTALGGPGFFGDGRYAIEITPPHSGTVPEPGAAALALTAALAAALATRRSRRRHATPVHHGD